MLAGGGTVPFTPQVTVQLLGDPVYGTQANRRYLKGHGIRFAGKPLGRPKKSDGSEPGRTETTEGTAARGIPAAHSD